MPILRKILQKLLNSNINFSNAEIKDIITEDSESKYKLSGEQLSKIKIYFSKTYADYYYCILLNINSCNKHLITIFTNIEKKEALKNLGPLTNNCVNAKG